MLRETHFTHPRFASRYRGLTNEIVTPPSVAPDIDERSNLPNILLPVLRASTKQGNGPLRAG